MAQSPNRQQLGAQVGRMVFQTRATSKLIEKKLGNSAQLQSALAKRGMGHVSAKKLADVFSGRDKSGLSQAELTKTVEALREAGIAKQPRTGRQLVTTAASEIKKGHVLPSLERSGRARGVMGVAEARALEEQMRAAQGQETNGILDKMRGVAGRMQAANRDESAEVDAAALAQLQQDAETRVSDADKGGIRGLRDSLKRALGIQDKPVTGDKIAARKVYKGGTDTSEHRQGGIGPGV